MLLITLQLKYVKLHYFLLLQAVKDQYSSNDYKIKQPLPVHFRNDAQIDVGYPHESSGWLIAKTCAGHTVGVYINGNSIKFHLCVPVR